VYIDVFTRETTAQEQQRTTALVLYQFLTTCFLAGAMTLFRGELPSIETISLSTVLIALLYTSLLATVVATGVQTHWQRFTTPVKAALIFSLEPVFASALGVIMLNEHFGLREISGGVLLLVGVLIAEIGPYVAAKLQWKNIPEQDSVV
jgi:drug/metabolite transporter (DMT)-like permease